MNTPFPYAYNPYSPYTPGPFHQYPTNTFYPGTTPWNNPWSNWNPGNTPYAGSPFAWFNPFNNTTPWNTTPWANAYSTGSAQWSYPANPAYNPGTHWNSTPWGNWGSAPIGQRNTWNNDNPWAYAAQNVAPGAFNPFNHPPVSAFPFAAAYPSNNATPTVPWYASMFNQNNPGIPGAYPFNAAFYGTNSPNRVNTPHGINAQQPPVREAA